MFGKSFFYTLWAAGEDIDTQRKGLVVLVWFEKNFNAVASNRLSAYAPMRVRASDLCTVRGASVHLCVPDTTTFRFVAATMKLRLGNPGRLKLKHHYGESVELLYKLQSYGIPTEHIPISFSGTIKTGYLKQWIRAREAQESTIYLELGNDLRGIIECPLMSDVLFRQGISLIANPGNATVRRLIEVMHEQQEVEFKNQVKLKRREMVLDIIEEVSKTSRFLSWNDGGWWSIIQDREQLILKIEYLIKEVRKSKREKHHPIKLKSSTSMFCHDSNKRPRTDSYGGNTDSSDDDGNSCVKGSCGKGCL